MTVSRGLRFCSLDTQHIIVEYTPLVNRVLVSLCLAPHLDCTIYAIAFAVPPAMPAVCLPAIVHVPPYRPLETVGEQASVFSESGSGIRSSIAATPVERSISSKVGDRQTQTATTKEEDTTPAVTAKEWHEESQQSPTVGQNVTKQSRPVASGDDLVADGLDARPTERCVLTGVAVGNWESERGEDGGVRSSEEGGKRKKQPDVGLMVRWDVLSTGLFSK